MKKFLSVLLASLLVLTAFGASTVFGGIISAGALYDYLIYTSIPGFSVFTDAELAMIQNRYVGAGVNETIEGVGPVVTWTRVGSNTWGSVEIYGAYARNLKKENHKDTSVNGDMPDATWAAKDTINGKTIMGDKSFEDEEGICFWVGLNGEPYTGKVSVRLWQIPSCGPFFIGEVDNDIGDHTAEELADYGNGFQYCSRSMQVDADGYAHFDFKTDFYQADWWSKDDDGIERQGTLYENNVPNYWPVPESKIAQISGLAFSFESTSIGDRISVGDIKMYHNKNVQFDELDEVMSEYDALDPQAYTEDSYIVATEAYLEAYEIINAPDISVYSQKMVNNAVKKLRYALKALEPMFMVKSESYIINGFDALSDDDIDEINDGGVSFDAAMLTDEFVPEGSARQSIYVIGGAFDGDPSYGWSRFSTSKLNGDGEVEAVNNVFGGSDLDESAGLRFWIKYSEDYVPAPTDMLIGVGSSAEGVYFECDPAVLTLPESEGYVGVVWNAFYDYEGDAEIYDYINDLDYITIGIEGCYQKGFYLSDLHIFEWNVNNASFEAMDQQIITAQNYLATLNKNEWSVRSWQRVEQSVEAARALHTEYAVTQDEVDSATDYIVKCLNRLTPIWDTATQEEIDALEAAYYNALTYWRGNYTGRSYADLKAVLDEVADYIADELGSAVCREFTGMVNEAVAGLVPITHGGTVAPTQATDTSGNPVTVKLFSIEDFSGSREFNQANGHRKDDVVYSLVTSAAGLDLPAKALKMTPKDGDLFSSHVDQHGALQFKLANYTCDPIHKDVITEDGNKIGGSIGDLSGSAGIRVWVGVNDVRLAQNAFFRFGVSNCQEGPLFERHAVNIPFPASGSGWIYIPWESFDFYDEWTEGQEINLAEIRFIIIRVDGEVPYGLEVYATCVSAYTDPTNTANAVPVVSNVTAGQSIDVAGGSFVPKWNVGNATLNGKRYLAGTPISVNDDYTLVVSNGDKQTSVSFTVTGGTDADALPVVSGVAEGGTYTGPVTITWDVGEATLNGEAIEKGTVVSAPGSYTLEVVNGTKTTSVRFTIEGGPALKRGDMDKDGEITVGDALKALRIAAQLVAATEEDYLIGDVDNDGDITVGDALKILRVAAKLVPESDLD